MKQISSGTAVTISPQRGLTFWNSNGATNDVSLQGFGDLNALHVKSPNEIYVGTSNGRLLILDSNGNVVQNLENTGGAAITKITQLSNGDIVTVDVNKNIRTWRNNQIINTVAGSADPGEISNLDVSNGLNPESILYTIGNRLYVANNANGEIQKILQAPTTISSFTPLRNGAVAIGAGQNIFYYNLNTGNAIKQTDTVNNNIVSMDANDNRLFAGTSTGDIISLDPYTGANFNARILNALISSDYLNFEKN